MVKNSDYVMGMYCGRFRERRDQQFSVERCVDRVAGVMVLDLPFLQFFKEFNFLSVCGILVFLGKN